VWANFRVFLSNFMKIHSTVFQLLYNQLSAWMVKGEALDTHRQLDGFQRTRARARTHTHTHTHTQQGN
jgi:hypothetical protein